jgi:hypothetical protein
MTWARHWRRKDERIDMVSWWCGRRPIVTAPEKRLDDASAALTARERAVLILRPWIAGGDGDERLRTNMPASQKAEVERIEDAINQLNTDLYSSLAFATEWLWTANVRLAWLEYLDGFLRREAARGEAPSKLPPLPKPSRAFMRDLPPLYGTVLGEDDPAPADWEAARALLLTDVTLAQLRWQECVAWKAVGAELEAVMGEEMLHRDIREAFERLGAKVLEIHDALQAIASPSSLPPPAEEHLENARKFVDWAALKPPLPPPGQTNGRPWMPPAELAELEALEARLAEELRAKRN